MSETVSPKITSTAFDNEVGRLKEASALSADACIVAQFIALSDSRVREIFFQKVDSGYVFRGIRCVSRIGIPENKSVMFDFDCMPGTFCLINPSFLVVVNLVERRVVSITDPVIPTSFGTLKGGPGGIPIIDREAQFGASSCQCEQARSGASNRELPNAANSGTFQGTSNAHDFHQALDAALAAAKEELRSTLVRWKLLGMSGEDGGFVQVHSLTVTILAWAI